MDSRPHILVADDEFSVRKLFQTVLGAKGYRVKAVEDGSRARTYMEQEKVDVAIFDLRMPGENGLDLFRKLKPVNPETAFILITAFGTAHTAIEAMKEGAFDYINKPFIIDEVELVVERALEMGRLNRELDRLKKQAHVNAPEEQFIGQSQAMQKVFKVIGRVAPTDASILVQGESGTGKEITARLIHQYSLRRDSPLVKVNCAALPEGLLESELFGYEKGAFTGAGQSKPGKLELAHGGTVFLDEIGEMPISLQTKMLRVLQEKEIEHLGGLRAIPVDIRVLASTNRNLSEAVASGLFREDLFYRLNVVNLTLPPLRERMGDIPLLAEFFMQMYSLRLGKNPLIISSEALALLESYYWPGNVRELKNAIERAVILAQGPVILPEHLPEELSPESSGSTVEQEAHQEKRSASPTKNSFLSSETFASGPLPTLRQALHETERILMAEALRRTGGNKSKTARILDISRRALQYKIEAYGLKTDFE
ncbi:MAG: sigma-54-dependent transcriptional regulator [Bacillota bacterium]